MYRLTCLQRDLLDAIKDLRTSFTKASESAVPTLHTMRNATMSYELKLHLAIQRWQDVPNFVMVCWLFALHSETNILSVCLKGQITVEHNLAIACRERLQM